MGILLSVLFGVLLFGQTASLAAWAPKIESKIYVFNLLVPLFYIDIGLDFPRRLAGTFYNTLMCYTEKVILLLVLSGLCGLGYAMMLMFAMNTRSPCSHLIHRRKLLGHNPTSTPSLYGRIPSALSV
jgi:hypothetical protein